MSQNDQQRFSAFPELPASPDALPEIPGGWKRDDVQLPDQLIKLFRPQNPDLFLDDEGVHEENAKHDYMPYWAFLWPSSIPMASAISRAPWPVGSEVLEVGAGIGLVGLASAIRGDRVVFSDYDDTALHLCRLNARLNGCSDPELLFLDWRKTPERQFPVIVGCEVTYDANLHDPLLDAISKLLATDGMCWLGDPGRIQAENFYRKAAAKGFELKLWNRDLKPMSKVVHGEFQILELRHGK